jgi:type I restriction enzyme S subunit
MTEWREASIEELCVRVTSGGTPSRRHTQYYSDATQGIPWVKSQELVGRTITSTDEYISDSGLRASSAKLLPPNTVLMAMYGANVGQLGYLGIEATVNQAICAMVTDPAVTDPRYLYYALVEVRHDLVGQAHGAAQQNLSQQLIKPYRLRVPSLQTQRRIGGILGSVDELIENNLRQVRVLEEMARAIYREWFVDFRFPGHEDVELVDSHRGPIPEGWSRTELQWIAKVNAVSRAPSADEVVRYLDISALGERSISALASITGKEAPGRARRVVHPGDVVWSMVRPSRRAHALLVSPGDDWIASTGLAVLTPGSVPSSYLFETVSAVEFSDYLVSRESGAAYPAVKPKDFEEAAVLLPDSERLSEFDSAVGPMHRMAWTLWDESASLAAMRDRLLPKLVTGQIDVSALDIDALVAGAVA